MEHKAPAATDPAPALSPAAMAALQRGNKIEAIKLVRRERNVGLKEAKDVVEAYVRNQPGLRASFEEAQAQTKRSVHLWAAVLLGVVLVAYLLFVKR